MSPHDSLVESLREEAGARIERVTGPGIIENASESALSRQELLKEREVPERAWIFYHTVTRSYTAAVRLLKQRSLAAGVAAGPGGGTASTARHGPGTLERQRSLIPSSALATAQAGTDWDDFSESAGGAGVSAGRQAAAVAVGVGAQRRRFG